MEATLFLLLLVPQCGWEWEGAGLCLVVVTFAGYIHFIIMIFFFVKLLKRDYF